MHKILIAAAAVALVALAYWYSTRASSPASGATYTATDNALMWANDPSGSYTCANSLVGGWCILPTEAAGAAACTADARCAGYLIPGSALTSSGTLQSLAQVNPGIVQLYSAPLASCAACTDTTVMSKNAA